MTARVDCTQRSKTAYGFEMALHSNAKWVCLYSLGELIPSLKSLETIMEVEYSLFIEEFSFPFGALFHFHVCWMEGIMGIPSKGSTWKFPLNQKGHE